MTKFIKAFFKYGLIIALIFSVCLSYSNFTFAEEGQPTEAQVKAAFIYNFGKFVEWPADRMGGKYFVIGVYNDDDFAQVLTEIVSGKFLHEKPILIKQFSRIEDITGCHILFVGYSAKDYLAELLNRAYKSPILMVGDMQDFANRGGMINFRMVGNYMRFEINVNAVQKTGLKMSSQLLKLAIVIK
ncbi:MAG: hypothetical protein APR62_05330 [Smithella sp. SDB]|nr:MAG: hypothetical protein APR62_05330 [Smithella sp. SDB]